jgi:hypothetical protein
VTARGAIEAHGEYSGVRVEDDANGTHERMSDLGRGLAGPVRGRATRVLFASRGERLRGSRAHGRVGVFAGLAGVAARLLEADRERGVDERGACLDLIGAPAMPDGHPDCLGHRRVELASGAGAGSRRARVERSETLAPSEDEDAIRMSLDDAGGDGHDARLARRERLGEGRPRLVAQLRVTSDEIESPFSNPRVVAA